MPGEKKPQTARTKQLKVLPKYFDRAYHQFAIFPEIRLAGKWYSETISNGQAKKDVQEIAHQPLKMNPA